MRMLRKPAILVLLVLLVSPLASFYRAAPARAEQGFADPAFARLWDRTDSLVASNQVTNRSWYWGPGPGVAGQEPYAQAPGGMRRVQYFDKARMEINHPDADPNSPWYVTTGLLVEDMVSGQMQVGDAQFVNRGAATIVVAGDADDSHAPTYASFRGVTSLNNTNRAPRQLGARVTSTINRAGQAGVDVTKAQDDGARIIAYNDVFGHNIPSAIWEFMNQAGVVNVDGQPVVDRPVMNWIFTIGYPISEAYWARVKVAGQPTDVLIQLFERRVLVYIPSFRAPWNVQMANVGIHYYQWLYGANGGPPPAGTPVPTVPPTNPPPTQRPTPIPPPPTFPVPTLPPSPAPPTATPGPGVPPSVGGDVSPLLGPAGTIFTVNVNGFQPHEPVAAWLTAPRGTVTVLTLAAGPGSDGQIRGISVNSAGFQNGVWALTVAGANSKHQSIVFFRVGTPPPPPPPPP
ncbi:MAG TPA: hypothetical protein VKY74_18525, partial [Chloroflexia bacterium]|nr:hypothetical protein [Chloroflexia bacterium]